jgi:hypothetical protein
VGPIATGNTTPNILSTPYYVDATLNGCNTSTSKIAASSYHNS